MNKWIDRSIGIKPGILVVDDEAAVLMMLQEVLEDKYTVYTADSVQQAEVMLNNLPICILICDYRMPGEDGLSFMIRNKDKYPDIIRILLTGYVEKKLLLDAINKSDITKYLVKPIQPQHLLNIVDEAWGIYQEITEYKKILVNHENEEEPHSPLRLNQRLRKLLPVLKETIGSLIFGVSLFLVCILFLGILVILFLYMMKSFFGIDILPETHLPDILRKILP